MGNSNTKESRPSNGTPGSSSAQDRRPAQPESSRSVLNGDRDSAQRSRPGRSELGFLSLTAAAAAAAAARDRDRQDAPFERKETRQEREARKLERERAARVKERERSLQEEHIDGGYLVTLGVYTGTEDFNKQVVRQLQIERKLAPFWRGLNDWSDNWTEHQLIAAARGLPIPAADATPDPELVPQQPPSKPSSTQNLQTLTVPMGERTLSTASDRSASGVPSPTTSQGQAASGHGKAMSFKPRAKALAAALNIPGSRNGSSTSLAMKEIKLPQDPFVNGQPLEVFLYKAAEECPICFLTYPPYLNRTRCCDQPICTECFVQIKRAEPHLPEHHPDGQTRDPNESLNPEDAPEMLISEPAACPYCQLPEFGVTYDAPPFRRGLTYTSSTLNLISSTAMSSQSSLNSSLSPNSPTQPGRRRTHSLSANAPNVTTTDRVRPDWSTKLSSARAHQARRAAAATALHTAAFLVGANEQRSILRNGRFSRRNTGNSGSRSRGAAASADAPGDGQHGSSEGVDASDSNAVGDLGEDSGRGRRTRMDELEDMMFMEAVRLSLATEEERKRKEEKAYRKDAKRRQKEERKALKRQARDPYSGATSGASKSSLSLSLGRRRGNSAASNLRVEATVQGASQASKDADGSLGSVCDGKEATHSGKGKGVDRGSPDLNESVSSAGPLPIPASPSRGGSHLRQMSNASSVGSSGTDSPSGSYSGPGCLGPDGKNKRASGLSVGGRSDDGDCESSNEPLFNFRSLAEMVGVNIEDGTARREEGEEDQEQRSASSPGDKTGRPLSQVKEDEKAEADAEHLEVKGSPKSCADGSSCGDGTPDNDEGYEGTAAKEDASTPELTITPGTPTPLEGPAAEFKRLGNQNITEHPKSHPLAQ